MALSVIYVVLFIVMSVIGLYGLYTLYRRRGTLSVLHSATLCALVVVTLVVIPFFMVTLGQSTLLFETKKIDSCATCHAMQPFVQDIKDPESLTLAARHMRNGFLGDGHDACAKCHIAPTLEGSIEAKLDGFRHLMKTITGTYTLPITFKKTQSNATCLSCHAETPKFKAKPLHTQNLEALQSGAVSCLNCHGPAHPPRSTRSK